MNKIKVNVGTLRSAARDLMDLRESGKINDDAAQAHDRVEKAHNTIFEVASFFDGLLVGLMAGGLVGDKDE